VRVIAATNRNLSAEVAAGRFREDLLYSLHVFPIVVPPLRERGSDVELLAQFFIDQYCARIGKPCPELTADCLRRLRSYRWPGNVRELENVIERAITLSQGGRITIEDLPPRVRLQTASDTPPLGADDLAELFSGLPNLDEIERRYVLHVLEATGNNRKRTAEILGINRKTLYRMAARFEIDFGPASAGKIDAEARALAATT